MCGNVEKELTFKIDLFYDEHHRQSFFKYLLRSVVGMYDCMFLRLVDPGYTI